MPERYDRLIRWGAGGMIALALGTSAGLGLGAYATGDGPVGLAERDPEPSFAADPITPDTDPDMAQMAERQQVSAPQTVTCVGCGPGIEERRLMAQQRAYDRYIERIDPLADAELATAEPIEAEETAGITH